MRIHLLEQFEKILYVHQSSVINFHYRLVGNKFDAEDLAQETFLKAYNKFETLKEVEKVKSWLFSIARNVTIDFFRRNKDRSIPLDSSILENYARATAVDYRDNVMKSELSAEIQKCLTKLNAQDQMIVKLLYYEGFSYREIGRLLQMNQSTLKSRLHRARRLLLEVIQSSDSLQDIALNYNK